MRKVFIETVTDPINEHRTTSSLYLVASRLNTRIKGGTFNTKAKEIRVEERIVLNLWFLTSLNEIVQIHQVQMLI